MLRPSVSTLLFAPSQVLSAISGGLFSIAWWLFIDGALTAKRATADNDSIPFKFVEYVPGLIAMIAFVMLQFVDPEDMKAESMFDAGRSKRSKVTAYFIRST